MKDEPSFMALAVNRVLADLDGGFLHRTKPIKLIFDKWPGSNGWLPILVCDLCGNGPITSLSGDDCCAPPKFLGMIEINAPNT